jgi:hypothetical protein
MRNNYFSRLHTVSSSFLEIYQKAMNVEQQIGFRYRPMSSSSLSHMKIKLSIIPVYNIFNRESHFDFTLTRQIIFYIFTFSFSSPVVQFLAILPPFASLFQCLCSVYDFSTLHNFSTPFLLPIFFLLVLFLLL